MNPMAKKLMLSLDDIGVGMSLAEPVLGAQGEVVLSHGVALTEALLQALRRRGIMRLSVLVPEPDTLSPPDAVQQTQMHLDRIARLFRNSGDEEGAAHLRALITQFRVEAKP